MECEDEVELCAPSRHEDENHALSGGCPQPDNDIDDIPIAQWPLTQKPTTNQTVFPTTIPISDILHLTPHRITTSGHPYPHELQAVTTRTPLTILKLFTPTSMFDTISNNTNNYAQSKGSRTGRGWQPVFGSELQVFVALCYYMGVFKCTLVEDYWNTWPTKPIPNITRRMSLTPLID